MRSTDIAPALAPENAYPTWYRRMQSVLPRRRQHAISYVLARGSMDRADRTQGIRLIALLPSLFSCLFPSLATFLSPFPFRPSLFLSLSIILFFSPSEYLGQQRFSIRTKACMPPSLSPLLYSHECIRALNYNGAIRICCGEFAASLALSTRRRAAVTSQSELQTKRVPASQPNVYFPEAVSHYVYRADADF